MNMTYIKPMTYIKAMTHLKRAVTMIACMTLAAIGTTAVAAVTQSIEPATIGLGEAARLTIAASGPEATRITPPMVSGLEFVAVGQSQRTESINGTTHATTSVTYQVIPRRVGVFTIPSGTADAEPVVLTVNSANGNASPASGALAHPSPSTQPSGATSVSANGSAFVRLRLSKHDLFVGETIPVDIQVGTRDGVVASLNGQPTLNGDAFTLDKLSEKPQRTAEVIDGKSFTVFTWHSALAAVKPGRLSLTMETPLTVRIRSAARPDMGLFGQLDMDDLFNDPNLQGSLQNFFGTSTEKDVTVASTPATFEVEPLPTQGRPANFSGAVGHFTLSSDVSDDKVTAGDPVTLHLHVAGTGNFDRVSSVMLHDVDHWKTYAPTATFEAEDQIGYKGEKTFDQPVIATQSGALSLPPLAFSWFDPSTRHYAEAHTSPLRISVGPAADASQTANARNVPAAPSLPPGGAGVLAAGTGDSAGLRPDHPNIGQSSSTLLPHYFAAPYLVPPSILSLAFLSAVFWVRRRERVADHVTAAREREAALQTAPLLTDMERAAGSSNAELFFRSARQAVQRVLASRWHVAPASVTLEEAKTRLGPQTDVAQLFELADEASYSKVKLTALDVKRWKSVVLQQINGEMAS